MRHGQWIVGADLRDDVAAGQALLQPVDPEGRQRGEPLQVVGREPRDRRHRGHSGHAGPGYARATRTVRYGRGPDPDRPLVRVSPWGSSAQMSSSRARATRDRIVPTGQPATVAAST